MVKRLLSIILLLCMFCGVATIMPAEIFAVDPTSTLIDLNYDLMLDPSCLYDELLKARTSDNDDDIYIYNFEYDSDSEETVSFKLRYKIISEKIYTPNGSDINADKGYALKFLDDIPDEIKSDIVAKDRALYSVNVISTATFNYNCHSYAWYNQSTSQNDIWLNYPDAYYSDYDRSYVQVTDPRIGDIVCYYGYNARGDFANLHSGIITGYTDQNSNGTIGDLNKYTVISKWGYGGLYEHRGDLCRYKRYTTEVRYYRPRTNESFNLSDDMSMASASATLKHDGSITDKYVMYELNVSDRMDYLITLQSTSCNVKFYDLHMNSFNVSSYQYTPAANTYLYTLPYGVSYIRIQNMSSTADSTISITVLPHAEHNFVYTVVDSSTHIQKCKCGAVGETGSHYWQSSSLDNYTECKLCGYLKRLNGEFIPIIKSKKTEIQPAFAYGDIAS